MAAQLFPSWWMWVDMSLWVWFAVLWWELMQFPNGTLEKYLMLRKIEGRKRRGHQRMRWLDGITDLMVMSLSKLRSWWWTGKPRVLQSMGLQRGRYWATELADRDSGKSWFKNQTTDSKMITTHWFQHNIVDGFRNEWRDSPLKRVECHDN